MNIKVGKQAIAEATQKLKNWGRWGKEDQIGTLNHVTPEDIVKAASLIRSGKIFALGIPPIARGLRPAFLVAASIRFTRCWPPARTPFPASKTGTRFAMQTTR